MKNEELAKIAYEIFRNRKLKLELSGGQIEDNKEDNFITGFLIGYNYLKSHPEITNESTASIAWKVSRDYLCDPTREHPLNYYVEKALKQQIQQDKETNKKQFRTWMEKAVEYCKKICKVYEQKAPNERIEIDLDELEKEIKGISHEF